MPPLPPSQQVRRCQTLSPPTPAAAGRRYDVWADGEKAPTAAVRSARGSVVGQQVAAGAWAAVRGTWAAMTVART